MPRYLKELRRWGATTNLVGSTDSEALGRHVADSVAAAAGLASGARVVDLGSGAGFPGIPLALSRPDLRVTLVEIRERRISFLRHVVRTLSIENVRVERARIESSPPELYDYALLRAVAPPSRAAELARPWVRPGGEFWIWASRGADIALERLSGSIDLESGGQILRFRVPEVSRGTPR
ncbi:MAG: 16S rRNA (guanine(527)-N(7))-methyltransferase RsmG [Myxococcota bacterium]